MSLVTSFERSGNYLFRNRSWLPLLLFIPAIPVIFFTAVDSWPAGLTRAVSIQAIALSVTGFLIRAWTIGTTPKGTSGRNTKSQVAESLNTKGIYSMLRHPLYLGNYFMWIGIVVFCFNFWFVLLASLAFWLYYERIMVAEERYLEGKFGQQFHSWASSVPAFLPSFRKYQPSAVPFSLRSVLRREYSGILACVTCFSVIHLLRAYIENERISTDDPAVITFSITLVITMILRSLKHHTRLLNESGRS